VHNGVACVDELCSFEYGGTQGFCDFEISTNPRAGRGPVLSVVNATLQEGLSYRSR